MRADTVRTFKRKSRFNLALRFPLSAGRWPLNRQSPIANYQSKIETVPSLVT